jgi:hypothetical protein
LSREQYGNIRSGDVPFVPQFFFRLFLHQGPEHLRCIAGPCDVCPSQLGVTLGHLDIRVAENLGKLYESYLVHLGSPGDGAAMASIDSPTEQAAGSPFLMV